MSVAPVAVRQLAGHVASRSNLDSIGQEILRQATLTRHYQAAKVIYREGDAADAAYVVLSGHLKAECYSSDGKAMLVSVLGRGDIFGELSLLDGRPRGATITALDDVALAVVPRTAFAILLAQSPALGQGLLELMSARLRKLAKVCETRTSAEVSMRLADALVGLTRKYGRDVEGAKQIPFRLSQQELGNMVGATRESVNKALRRWTQLGVLSHEDGFLTILDGRALHELIESRDADRLSA